MKTAKEFFKEEYSEHNSMAHYPPSENRIAEIMEAYAKYYHEQQVNSVDLADVGNCAYLKNFGEDLKAVEITDDMKIWAKEQLEKSNKKKFLKTLRGD